MTPSFGQLSPLGLLLVVGVAAYARGRFYATFAGVLLGIHTLVSVALAPYFAWAHPLYGCLQAAVYLHFLSLVRPRLRPFAYRAIVSIPASWFAAGTLLAFQNVPKIPVLDGPGPSWDGGERRVDDEDGVGRPGR